MAIIQLVERGDYKAAAVDPSWRRNAAGAQGRGDEGRVKLQEMKIRIRTSYFPSCPLAPTPFCTGGFSINLGVRLWKVF